MRDFRREGGKRFDGDRGGGFGRRDSGRSNFSRNSRGGSGGRDRGSVTMHQAVCDQCGRPCEVPFRPTEGKPVYCNDCFGAKKETGNNRGRDRFPQKRFDAGKGDNNELKKQLETLNIKMDKLIKAVESMTSAKPLAAEKTVPDAKVKKLIKNVFKKKKKLKNRLA